MLDRPEHLDARRQRTHTETVAAIDPWAPADPVGEALHFLRMNGAFYCRSELSAPWGLTLPPMPGYLWFHVVSSGRVWLETGAADPALLQHGDLALVPHGEGHALRSEPGVQAPGILELEREQVSERYEILRHGEGGVPTTLICGAVRFDNPAARNLVEILPATIHIEASDSVQLDWMHSILRLMAAEAKELRPGGEAVITRLGDILVIQAIRAWIETDPAARTGWLGALQDRQIGRALSLIHRDPSRAWTVATLADELAMSRSAFAARFTELVDEPAMQYVTRWRMHVALNSLKEQDATVAELAGRLGYRSEAAFARAFKRVIGVPPGAVKRAPETALV
ncbi:MAG: AraC family transcriptional regulator [Thermoleophilaceae bacterium]|nr:AraC family transcriptional regulator [Thermoleophilaceae bacterium]